MSLNVITTKEITDLTKTILGVIEEQALKQRKDMKEFLKNTNLSQEQKSKTYLDFSVSLFNTKINTGLQLSQQYILRDKELYEQKKLNIENIELIKKQTAVQVQEQLIAVEKVLLAKEQVNQAKEEIKAIKTKTFLEIIKTEATVDNTIASTLTEVRKNGAIVTTTPRTYTDAGTGQVIDYEHISLAAAEATDITKGMFGLQMALLKNQSDTFKDHTKLQFSNQVMQLINSALSNDLTSIAGLLNTHKNIGKDLLGNNEVFDTNYSSIA